MVRGVIFMIKIFISHNWKDDSFVERVFKKLKRDIEQWLSIFKSRTYFRRKFNILSLPRMAYFEIFGEDIKNIRLFH